MSYEPLEIIEALREKVQNINRPFTLDELQAMEISDNEWVVEKLIPSGVTLLTGASRSYKTFIMQSMAIAVSQGLPFLDTFGTTQSNVLIVDEENHKGILQKRYRALNAPAGLPIHFYSMFGMKIDNKDNMMEILEYCKKCNIRMVIMDSLVRIHSANENSADEMSRALKGLNVLTEAGISVVLIHHHRKQQAGSRSGFESIRGSSDIFAFVDCHIGVERDGNLITLTQDKLRTDEETAPFKVKLCKGEHKSVSFLYEGVVETQDGLEVTVLEVMTVAIKTGTECTIKYLATETDASRFVLNKVLNRLVENGKVTITKMAHNKSAYSLVEPVVQDDCAETII